MMDPTTKTDQTEHELGSSAVLDNDESNNNHNEDYEAEIKPSIYDVVGTNDQELARRQYLEDDTDDSDSRNCGNGNKRHSTIEPAPKRQALSYDETNGVINGQGTELKADEENFSKLGDSNVNGYQDEQEYNSYSSNGGSQHENDHERQHRQHSDEPEQMRKLFIGGLDYKTSEETLKHHFGKFGDVIDCVVMRESQSKRSRGFGFVIYANSHEVDEAQKARPHEVDGREVQSKRAVSREDSAKPEAQLTVMKVYLGGLNDDIEESDLRDYFKVYGNIVNINIVAHKDTGKRRGFAFVEFDDYDPVDKIVLRKFHTIKDRRFEAKKAIPKVEMDARKRGDIRPPMSNAMMALSGPPLDSPGGRPRPGRNNAVCLWDGGPYNTGSGYPGSYSNQASLDGYPPHYHPPSTHYGANWMMHGGQGVGPYGFRGSHGGGSGGSGLYGRNFSGQTSGWTSAADYGGFSTAQGGAGPMRLSYQSRGWGPYGSGYGAHRGRGYNS